jgi:hypothetical protein
MDWGTVGIVIDFSANAFGSGFVKNGCVLLDYV